MYESWNEGRSWRQGAFLFVCLSILCGSLTAFASGPGGFLENQGSTPRAKWNAGQIAAAVPSTRGVFTFPSPYNTKAWRITDATDCSGGADCVWYVGYAYWRNTNFSASSNILKIFIGSKDSTGAMLFHLDKTTDALTKIGPVFAPGSPWRGFTAEGWYWNHSNQDWLYISDQTHWYRYNVTNGTEQLMIDAVGMWGANREVVQMHSALDDNQHVFTVRVGDTNAMLGCGYYKESPSVIRLYSHTTMNECLIDQSGRWTLVLFNDGSQKIYDNSDGSLDSTVAEGTTAMGHTDAGWEFFVGNSNLYDVNAATTVLWSANPPTFQGPMYSYGNYNQQPFQHVALPRSTTATYTAQLACGSEVDASAFQNEVTCVRLTGTSQQLIVAPILSSLSATGGEFSCNPAAYDYCKAPKGNLDESGQYFVFTTNLGGNRLDAVLVKVPSQLLIPEALGGTGRASGKFRANGGVRTH